MRGSVHEFACAMREAGLEPPPEIVADGKFHRYKLPEDRGKKSGWYIAFEDCDGGKAGNWKIGFKMVWQRKAAKDMGEEEKARYRANLEASRIKAERVKTMENQKAAQEAKKIWDRSDAVTTFDYLTRKACKNYGLREYKGKLVVPVRNDRRTLTGLQFIDPDGTKMFLTGTEKAGCYFSIGRPEKVVCIVEGYATGASVHECTGYAVAVAFDAGNLTPVAIKIKNNLPHCVTVICGDNDKNNVGEVRGKEAAKSSSGIFVMPPYEGMDWNDMHKEYGAKEVATLISLAINCP